MEGNSAVASRRNAAYAFLRTLRYTGQARFSFDGFVRHHIEAHVILMDEGELVLETKKVTNLLACVQDPLLASAITHIEGDREKLQDFEECQQYLKTVIINTNIHRKTLPSAVFEDRNCQH